MKKILNENRWLALILVASVIVRVVASAAIGDTVTNLPGTYDQISYHTLALRVLNGYGFSFNEMWWPITQANAPTAHWSFLYTLYLTGVYFLFGPHPLIARIIQAILVGILQPYLVFRIASLIFSKKIGLVSAGITALYAYFIYYAATLMTEPFYITFLLGVFLITIKISKANFAEAGNKFNGQLFKQFLLLGLCLAGCILLRQLFLIIVPLLFLWLGWVKRKQISRTFILGLVSSSVLIGLFIFPFTLYNYARFNSFVLLNTNSGYAFYFANHPIYGTHFQSILPPEMGSYQSLIPDSLKSLNEAALDSALLKLGLQFVLDDPVRYGLLSISRIPAYFMFWPSKDSELISNLSRTASFGLMLPFMIYGLFRSIRIQKLSLADRLADPAFLLIFFVMAYSLIHILSWSLIRYRLPVDALLVIFAAVALVELAGRILDLPYMKNRRIRAKLKSLSLSGSQNLGIKKSK